MRVFAFIAALLLAASPATAAGLTVVASFSILGDMVQRVGGDRVALTTIVGPDADTHVYEPKPTDAAALAGADLFVVNGLGFEGWMERLVEATGYAGPVIVASEGVTPHAMAEEAEDHEDHESHGDHEQGGIDPHAWQDLQNGILYVRTIAAALCAADAEGCAGYSANAATYEAELAALDAELRTRLSALPAGQRRIITTHDAFGYFGAAYGVVFLAPEGISTDAEPSAATVARLIRQIKAEGVRALFIENMSDGRLVQQIATETGATLGGTLYADALSPADGPAPTYLRMFAYNVDQMLPAMGGQ
jgi:zinc/manganese transport system substrate-binding protein